MDRRLTLVVVAVVSVVVLSACGSSSSPSSPSPSQPTPVPTSAMNGAVTALIGAFNSSYKATSSKRSVGKIRPEFLVHVSTPDFRQACANGGYISTTGVTMTGSLDDRTGQGTLNWESYQSFVQCDLGGGWVISSSPYESFGGTIYLSANGARLNIRLGGGDTWYFNGQKAGTAWFNAALLQWDTVTGWSNSGQFCGQVTGGLQQCVNFSDWR